MSVDSLSLPKRRTSREQVVTRKPGRHRGTWYARSLLALSALTLVVSVLPSQSLRSATLVMPPGETTAIRSLPATPAGTFHAGGSAVLFRSDFSDGLLDGGKWTRWGAQRSLDVADNPGGFPTAKVLRVRMGTGDFDWVEASGKWSLPAVGESRAFRVYFRNAISATSGGWAATHPVESKGTDGSIAGNFYAWHIGAAGEWAFATSAAQPRNYFTINPTNEDVGKLAKNLTYRVEWKWTRQASGYALDMRIYDEAGKLVHDGASIRAWGGHSLASNNGGIPLDDWAVTGIRFGINGGFAASGTNYVYWSGFAVCTDWCGPYSAGR